MNYSQKSQGIANGVFVRVGSTNRQADGPLTAEMRHSALNLRLASGLFAGLREWNESMPETLRLVLLNQGRVAPTVGGVLLFGIDRERYFPDALICRVLERVHVVWLRHVDRSINSL